MSVDLYALIVATICLVHSQIIKRSDRSTEAKGILISISILGLITFIPIYGMFICNDYTNITYSITLIFLTELSNLFVKLSTRNSSSPEKTAISIFVLCLTLATITFSYLGWEFLITMPILVALGISSLFQIIETKCIKYCF